MLNLASTVTLHPFEPMIVSDNMLVISLNTCFTIKGQPT